MKATQRLLRVNGFRVETFDSGQTFLTSLHDRIPDCALIDLYMPDLTGWEIHAILKASALTVPVIFVTANSDFASYKSLPGVDGIVTLLHKPFTEQQILEAIGYLKAG